MNIFDCFKHLDKNGLDTLIKLIKPGFKRIWHGTQEDWDALPAAQKNKYDQSEISGNSNEGVIFVDTEANIGSLNPITSDAVAKLHRVIGTHVITTIPVPANSGYTPHTITLNTGVPNGVFVLMGVFGSIAASTTGQTEVAASIFFAPWCGYSIVGELGYAPGIHPVQANAAGVITITENITNPTGVQFNFSVRAYCIGLKG